MKTALVLCLVAAGVAGCGPEELPPLGQVLLHVDTDAPLRPPQGTPLGPDDPLPLFDRLRIDVAGPMGEVCAGCSREVALFASTEPISFGLMLPPGEPGFTAKVRLFRSILNATEPRPDSTIDTTVALPVIAEEGIVHVSVLLRTDDVGRPRGSVDAPEAPVLEAPGISQQGSWPGARRLPCNGLPQPGEVCVRGGAFWMGQPTVIVTSDTPTLVAERRLTIVKPFWVDAHETTVAEARPYLEETHDLGFAPWTGKNSGPLAGWKYEDWCSFSYDIAHDPLPMNCIGWSTALRICGTRASGLPSEAQFEFLASGLVSDLYLWGTNDPDCDDAVFARAGEGEYAQDGNGYCRPAEGFGGPVPGGAGTRDVLQVEGGAIFDLAGNVREWTSDRFVPEGDACLPAGILEDPACPPIDPDDGDLRSVRGGGWTALGARLRAATRAAADPHLADPGIGFRCARAASGD